MSEVKEILSSSDSKMQKNVEHLQTELSSIRAGKASVNILNGINIESYGSQMPINQVASVTVPDAKTVLIQPWDKTMISPIEKAIVDSNIGPSNNGEQIRLNMPPVTEDRRKTLVKQAKEEGEKSKVGLRNIRREAMDMIKKAQKDGLGEDMAKDAEASIQKLVDTYIKQIDAECVVKEKEIMTV